MADISTSPHLTAGPYSPLEALTMRALRRFGEMSPSTVEGDSMLTFLDYGNEVIDDILQHPYYSGPVIPYYRHPTEDRPVQDHIMVAGLLFRFAFEKRSAMAAQYEAAYYGKLNQIMMRERFGPGAQFELRAVDYPPRRPA